MTEKTIRLCMISGSFEYDSETSLRKFQRYVEQHRPVKSTLIVYKNEDDPQSLKSIEDADVLLVFTRRLNTFGEELERFKRYCEQGKPIVGVRTASHAYQNWLAFDKAALGGDYQGHYGGGPIVRASVAPGANAHPVLHGVSDFDTYGSLYKNPSIAPDTTLLLTGSTPEHTEPVAWTRLHRGGRVFYTSLGHQKDFDVEMFLRLLANAVMWCAESPKAKEAAALRQSAA